jgi:hypothetical protein
LQNETTIPKTTTEDIDDESKSASSSSVPLKANGKDSRVKPLLEEFTELVGYTLPNYGQEGKAAKQMLGRDYSPEEIFSCWRYMQTNPFWIGKHCGLVSVNKNIGAWKKAGKPKEDASAQGGRRSPGASGGCRNSEAERVAKAQVERRRKRAAEMSEVQ